MQSFELLKSGMDGLIVACKQHPTAILLALMKYLSPSRPFAVFSPYKEPLLETYTAVKAGNSIAKHKPFTVKACVHT